MDDGKLRFYAHCGIANGTLIVFGLNLVKQFPRKIYWQKDLNMSRNGSNFQTFELGAQ